MAFSMLSIIIVALVVIIFAGVAAFIGVTFARTTAEWRRNNQAPPQTLPAKLVAKRTEGRQQPDAYTDTAFYFGTFELENGERREFSMKSQEYGLLAEGSAGRLTFQGTRLLHFDPLE